MSEELTIFGVGEMAELAHFYFSHARCRYSAFCVD